MLVVVDTEAGTNQQFTTKAELVEWAMKEAPTNFSASTRVKYLEGIMVEMFTVLEKEMKTMRKLPEQITNEGTSNYKKFLLPISTNVDPLKKVTNTSRFYDTTEEDKCSMGTSLEELETGDAKPEQPEKETQEEKFDRLMDEYSEKREPTQIEEVFNEPLLGVTDLTVVEKDIEEIKERMRGPPRWGLERTEKDHMEALTDLVDWFAEKFCVPNTVKPNADKKDFDTNSKLLFTDLCWKLFIRNPELVCTTILNQVQPVKIKALIEKISMPPNSNYINKAELFQKNDYKSIYLEITSIQKYQPGLVIRSEYFTEFRTLYETMLTNVKTSIKWLFFDDITSEGYNRHIYLEPTFGLLGVEPYQIIKDMFDTYDQYLKGSLTANTTFLWMKRGMEEKYEKHPIDTTGLRSSEIDAEVRKYFNQYFGGVLKLQERLLSFLTPQFFSRSMAKLEYPKVRRGKGYYYTNIVAAKEAQKEGTTAPARKYDDALKADVEKKATEIVMPLFMETTLCGGSNLLAGAPYM
jgi:hypothetical protein